MHRLTVKYRPKTASACDSIPVGDELTVRLDPWKRKPSQGQLCVVQFFDGEYGLRRYFRYRHLPVFLTERAQQPKQYKPIYRAMPVVKTKFTRPAQKPIIERCRQALVDVFYQMVEVCRITRSVTVA